MFTSPAEAIVYAMKTSKLIVHRFIDDLKPAEFEYQPTPGGNCAAWILGHLTLTDRRSLVWLGATDLPTLPPGYEEMFQRTGQKAGDQKGYGDPKVLVNLFDAHRDQLAEVLKTVDPAKFLEQPAMQSPMFSYKGEAYLFMALHTAVHMGHVSAIRRALGYPPVS